MFLLAPVLAALATILLFSPTSASPAAQATGTPISVIDGDTLEPPFWFDLIPSLENGKITYQVALYSQVERPMLDMVIKIPVPEGTRYLDSSSLPDVNLQFDGENVLFVTAFLDKYIEDAQFTVEIIDPARTVFSTQPQISWKGELAGSHLTEPLSFDITRKPLNWTESYSRFELGAEATVGDEIITYKLYPKAMGPERMWDLAISVSLPEGVTPLAVEAPPPFEAGLNDQQITFFTLELARQLETGPLTFKVSTTGITNSTIAIPVWAAWKNGEKDPIPGATVEHSRKRSSFDEQEPPPPGEEVILLETEISKPTIPQTVVFDLRDDVPFSNYDLTSIALIDNGSALIARFNTAAAVGPVGSPSDFTLFIDSDCNSNTGQPRQNRGADYRVNYKHDTGWTSITAWDTTQQDWDWSQMFDLVGFSNEKTVTILLPRTLINLGREFCWTGWSTNETELFYPPPPRDIVPNTEHSTLARYQLPTTTSSIDLERDLGFPPIIEVEDTTGDFDETFDELAVVLAAGTELTGKLAVPLADGYGFSDVHVFSLTDGQQLEQISNARQPYFRSDGNRLLVNHERNAGGNAYQFSLDDGRKDVIIFRNYDAADGIYEFNLADGAESQVSNDPQHAFPSYNPTGSQVAYESSSFMPGTVEAQVSTIHVQCSLLPPGQETEPECQNLGEVGPLLSPTGQVREISGSHPVWASNDTIVYNGCDDQAARKLCGIYAINSKAAKRESDGTTPVRLTRHSSDIPADSRGNLIVFSSQRDGNWEAYSMSLEGTGIRNLSNSPNSNDGLPAISPDGKWVAFVSDRGGSWAVWFVAAGGGAARKLFNLPVDPPWNDSERIWVEERISWGP